jgi:hypothetical protein
MNDAHALRQVDGLPRAQKRSMSLRRCRFRAGTLAAGVLAAACLGTGAARADIRTPNPPKYPVEIEPHLLLAPDIYGYGGASFGLGARFSIPVMSPGFVKSINDSIAITFGPDLVNFAGYTYYGNCNRNGCVAYGAGDFWALYSSVALQWNFFLSDHWSVFGEPGVGFRHAFWGTGYCPAGYACGGYGVDTLYPTFWAGARYHFSKSVALTMRLGYPVFLSIGVSFFP